MRKEQKLPQKHPKYDDDRRKELADFLKTRRARVSPPERTHFPFSRRRTPGLRREEVAEMAGVSASWYTWLEQGRDVSPSPELLLRLGRVLRLNSSELNHLFDLAGKTAPEAPGKTAEEVPPALQQLVTNFLQVPAFVIGERFEILMWNRRFEKQIYDIGRIPPERRTVLDMIFTDEETKKLRPDWEEDARRTVAEFRWSVGKKIGSPGVKELITRMCRESRKFAELWQLHDIQERKKSRIVELQHEKWGRRRFMRSIYVPVESDELRLVILTPLNPGSRAGRGARSPANGADKASPAGT